MALTRKFHLRDLSTSSHLDIDEKLLIQLSSKLAGQETLLTVNNQTDSNLTNLILQRLGGENVALLIPNLSREQLLDALKTILQHKGNLYLQLYNRNMLVIDPAFIVDDSISLSGGSFSQVLLEHFENNFIIRKRIQKAPSRNNIDTDLRLHYEANWLSKLPEQAGSLFPKLKSVYASNNEIGYTAEFKPWPSVAELIFQNCIDHEQLFSILKEVYNKLKSNLYKFQSIQLPRLPNEVSYLDKIERRTKAILSANHNPSIFLHTFYNAPWLRINGVTCYSQLTLLKILRSKKEWQSVINPHPVNERLCHGDLILEDILVNPLDQKDFRLIDPNPMNRFPIFDLAKTMLSLWIGYEFFYYDLFSIKEYEVYPDGGISVTIEIDRKDCQGIYQKTANLFMDFIKQEMIDIVFPNIDHFEAKIQMASALQALAIPMFHFLNYNNEPRAFAFACMGLYHAQRALSELS